MRFNIRVPKVRVPARGATGSFPVAISQPGRRPIPAGNLIVSNRGGAVGTKFVPSRQLSELHRTKTALDKKSVRDLHPTRGGTSRPIR